MTLIAPQGGTLVNRIPPDDQRTSLREGAARLPGLTLDPRALAYLALIGTGAASPPTGFAGRARRRRGELPAPVPALSASGALPHEVTA
jgi:sulfate adenylyltransferase